MRASSWFKLAEICTVFDSVEAQCLGAQLCEAGCCSRQPNQPFKNKREAPKSSINRRVPHFLVHIEGKIVFDSRNTLIELNCYGGFGSPNTLTVLALPI